MLYSISISIFVDIYKTETMKTEEIKELFTQFESIVCDYNGVECWSARELQSLLGYVKWDKFINVIN